MSKKPAGICGPQVFSAAPQAPGKAGTENSDCLLQQVGTTMQEKNAARGRASGFTLLEMAIVLAIAMVVSGMVFLTITSLLPGQHLINAYNITMAVMRQARDNAMAQRTSYSVTFSNAAAPNTIVLAPVLPTGGTAFTGEQSTVT